MSSDARNPLLQSPLGEVAAADEEPKEHDDKSPKKSTVLSPFSIFTLTINFIIGIGVLDLPYIFLQAGIVLCSVLVVLSALASNLAVDYVIESQARGVMKGMGASSAVDAVDHWKKIELSEMCEVFVGKWFKYAYLVIYFIFQESSLWSMAAVFAQMAASIVSPLLDAAPNASAVNNSCTGVSFDTQCQDVYYVVLAVFGLLETAMTVLGLKEQAVVQAILAVYRFAAILAMAVLAAVGLGKGTLLDGGNATEEFVYWRWSGFAGALPPIMFAQLLQMACPGLMEVMPYKAKAQAHFFGAFATTSGCYIFIGEMAAC